MIFWNEKDNFYGFFLFVCLFRGIVPLENFSLIWRCHHYWWRAANFDLCSTRTAIEQWGFFSVSHLLWHGTSVYNVHLRGPVTLATIAERLAVELSLRVFLWHKKVKKFCRCWQSLAPPLSSCANYTCRLVEIFPNSWICGIIHTSTIAQTLWHKIMTFQQQMCPAFSLVASNIMNIMDQPSWSMMYETCWIMLPVIIS